MIQINRSCCYVEEGNNACPAEGGNEIVEETETYVKYYTRCKDELCNNSQGDHSDLNPDSDDDHAVVVVNGRSSGIPRTPTGPLTMILLGLVIFLTL